MKFDKYSPDDDDGTGLKAHRNNQQVSCVATPRTSRALTTWCPAGVLRTDCCPDRSPGDGFRRRDSRTAASRSPRVPAASCRPAARRYSGDRRRRRRRRSRRTARPSCSRPNIRWNRSALSAAVGTEPRRRRSSRTRGS